MKKLITFLLFAGFYLVSAQTVSGTLKEKSGKKIPFAEVVLSADKFRKSAVTDEGGNFKIDLQKSGDYLLEVFHEGEKRLEKKLSISKDLSEDIVLESLTKSKESEQKIEGVNIVARKKLVERKVDRLVFNVENSVASQGVDGFEALSKTPLLRVKDDAISIAGKSNVSVLVNDRPVNLSGQDLTNYLKSLRSDDIQRIEVITTPPSKYAAEGSSGLINIVLKKNTNIGWNATLRTGNNITRKFSFNDGATFNYQGKKFSLTANGSLGEYNGIGAEDNLSYGQNYYWEGKKKSSYQYRYKGANIKTEYKLNDKNTVGIGYGFNFSNPHNFSNGITKTLINGISNEFSSDTDNNGNYNNGNLNAFYEVKLDTLGSKLNISGNIMRNKVDSDNFTNTYGITDIHSNTKNGSVYKIMNGQIDLEKNFSKIRTEAGLKYAKINNDADLLFYDFLNGTPNLNALRSNSFQYDEQNFAVYVSAGFKITEKIDTKLGLRYEYTTTDGFSPQYNQRTENQYGKLFPTAFLSYRPDENNALSLNYSRRIRRPYFGSLNPFRYYTSDYEYWGGNPFLQPSFTDNLELSYTLKNNFTTSIYGSLTDDSIDQIQRIENGIRYSTPANFYDERRAGINMNYNFTKFSWLESNLSAGGYYSDSKSEDNTVLTQKGLGANFSMDNNFFLNKAKTVTYVLGFFMDTPSSNGISQNNGFKYFYTGLKLNLMEKNLMINMYVNDLLNSGNWKGKSYYKDYTNEYNYRNYQQGVNLSVTYKFGNQNVRGATKQIKNEEESRNGGGGNQTGGK